MALFMIQAAYTPEAWAAMAKNPQDRREAIRPLAEKVGGKLLDIYFCLGEYDVVVLVEAPDAESAAAMSVGAVSVGHLKSIRTTQLFTADQGLAIMRKAGALGPLRAPTAG
jgi:uncharacterized protein with GYD domain